MKKLILSFLFISAFAFITFGQEMQDNGSYKPTSGFTTEVNFVPANTSMPISMDYLKLRMFMSENMAIRLGFNFNMRSEKYENLPPVGSTAPIEKTKNSYTIFGIVPGIELHMGDMPKLSPYVGADLGFFLKSSKTEITNWGNENYTYESNGAWSTAGIYPVPTVLSEQGYTQIVFNLVLGTDYYFSKHFFTGIEIGLGLENTSYKEIKITSNRPDVSETIPKTKIMNIGFNYNPAFRLGWAF